MTEIPQRREQEEALAARETEFRAIFELAGAGTVQADPVTARYLRVNRRFCEITGYSEAELLQLTFTDITHPDDRARDRQAFDRAVRGEREGWENEKRYVRKDGSIAWVLVTGRILRDQAGRPVRTLAVILDVTERRRAERLLARYRLFSQHAHDIVLFVLPDGRITEANEAAVTAYGYSRDELLRLTITDLRDPATLPLIPEQMHQADAQGATFESVHRRKDGSTFPVEVSSRGADLDGERVLLSIIRDISERKRAEAELRESERRYRDLFENANDIIYTLDLQGRVTSVNRRAERTFGYTLDEIGGQSVTTIIPPEYHARMYSALQRKIEGEQPTVYELEVLRKDGTRVPLEISNRLIKKDGKPVGIQGIARDISERRRAQEALRESEERLRLALDAGRIGVWDWDIPGNHVTWSDRICEFHGLKPGEFGGRVEDFMRLIHPDDLESVNQAIRRTLEQKVPYSLEFRIIRPSGEVRWLSTTGRVLYELDRPVRMLGATQDVTERRAAEDALREADRRKDEFLAMLAHELRNPLAPVRTAVQVLKITGPADPNLQQARDMIDRQVTHMARLVDDLLDVSRITRGKVLLRREPLDLTVLVRATVEDHRPLLESRGLQITVALPPGPVWVLGDPTRVAQMIGNLLHNAGKFTDPGGQVRVHLEEEREQTKTLGFAELTVEDTGVGLDADMLRRLFEPFSQADRSLDRSRGGLGLGLALVKGLVELHGGSITASSAGPGKGAKFVLRLPVVGAPPTMPGSPLPGGQRPGGAAPNAPVGRGGRILVIEDNRDVADSLRMLLELTGYQVAISSTGAAGLESARSFVPDVVLCDIGLPGGMDGYDVAQALRADPELFGTSLFALSGYGQAEDQRKARQAGFDRHLTKPVDPEMLLGLLDLVIRSRK